MLSTTKEISDHFVGSAPSTNNFSEIRFIVKHSGNTLLSAFIYIIQELSSVTMLYTDIGYFRLNHHDLFGMNPLDTSSPCKIVFIVVYDMLRDSYSCSSRIWLRLELDYRLLVDLRSLETLIFRRFTVVFSFERQCFGSIVDVLEGFWSFDTDAGLDWVWAQHCDKS